MRIGSGILLTATLCLAAATVWAAESTPAPPAPTTITMGCFSNTCGAALTAAIKRGDPKAALEAGGLGVDVLAAMVAGETLAGRNVMGMSGSALLAQIKPGSVRMGAPNERTGEPSVSFETQDGRAVMMMRALISATPGGPPQPIAVAYGFPPGLTGAPASAPPQR